MTTQETALERPCPSCGEPVALSSSELVAGTRVRCLHCNAEALVEKEFDAALNLHHWTLEDPEDDVTEEGP